MGELMRSRRSFTGEEVIMIRLLVRLKALAEPQAQEILADKMQAIGFHPEDFQLDYADMSVAQFEALLGTGSIAVRGGSAMAMSCMREN
jgi:hypothetical protein